MPKQHAYASRIIWTGNTGSGTQSYRADQRTWDIAIAGKPAIHGSNDPLLGGNPALMGIGETSPNRAGRFLSATLRPRVVIAPGGDLAQANAIHGDIHAYCFIARSVNFPVNHEPNTSFG